MRPAGIRAWEARREDRQAIYAYEQAQLLALPEAYAAQLASSPAAAAFWAETTASYRKICINWVLSAKQQPLPARPDNGPGARWSSGDPG